MNKKTNKGFTLIELLLVVVIMGIMLAVIVPRGQRATVDAKYSQVRQNGSEVAAFALQWAELMINAQDDSAGATLKDYMDSLAIITQTSAGLNGSSGILPVGFENIDSRGLAVDGNYVGTTVGSNWNGEASVEVNNRTVGGLQENTFSGSSNGFTPVALLGGAVPETTVSGIVDPGKEPRNPFNGLSVFHANNFHAENVVPGALAAYGTLDNTRAGNWFYYALVFEGTDSTAHADYHGGMGTELAGLRNGIFIARLPGGASSIINFNQFFNLMNSTEI